MADTENSPRRQELVAKVKRLWDELMKSIDIRA